MQKTTVILFTALLVIVFTAFHSFSSEKKEFSDIPLKGVVTMVDLGAKKCIPCKMMAPILVKLEKAYYGKAAIVFIDVWENKQQAKRFGIRGIPTQIFFDEDGKEIFRHTGFFDEQSIISQLTRMGVPAPDMDSKG